MKSSEEINQPAATEGIKANLFPPISTAPFLASFPNLLEPSKARFKAKKYLLDML